MARRLSHVSRCMRVIALCTASLLLPSGGLCAASSSQSTPSEVRGRIIISRSDAAWQSQQIQEACILPNPRDPSKLVMFYSGVPKTNRVLCEVGKAWADVADPFTWHQNEENPIFGPSGRGWDARTMRLDAVLHVPEEDAYYIYYSATTGGIQDHIGLAITPVGDGYASVNAGTIKRYGDAPILAPEPAAPFYEKMVSQSAVWREPGSKFDSWHFRRPLIFRGKPLFQR